MSDNRRKISKRMCVVKSCINYKNKGEDHQYHRFPKNDHQRMLWCNAIKINWDQYCDKSRSFSICSDHFVASDYNCKNLKWKRIPSLRLGLSESSILKKFCSQKENNSSIYNFEDESIADEPMPEQSDDQKDLATRLVSYFDVATNKRNKEIILLNAFLKFKVA